MLQIAVFVDAGYLYAQGSVLLAGQKQPRTALELKVPEVLARLRATAQAVCPEGRMLRIYWYDGLLRNFRPSSEQNDVANAPLAKLRLGMMNSQGVQKGVDSLIVTDLIELARNRAISDALLLSGDEDIRIGVQIAQTFGVQVHLLGIQPARGSQSPDLIQESDTHQEWSKEHVQDFLSLRPVNHDVGPRGVDDPLAVAPAAQHELSLDDVVQAEIENALAKLTSSTRESVRRFAIANPGRVPPEVDRPVLGTIRNRLDRALSNEERKAYRDRFSRLLAE
jgi:hypothetical protein